jgi:membrane-associated protease RseP (regulator of RpoE activity)
MQKKTIIIALSFLLLGFVSAYLIFAYTTENSTASDTSDRLITVGGTVITNPFSVKDDSEQKDTKIQSLESEIISIRQRLQQIESTLQELSEASVSAQGTSSLTSRLSPSNRGRFTSALSQRLYNLDSLIRGGIDPSLAEDIVRRKNSIELKRLALQDRATREGYLNSEQYFDELEVINSEDVSLRDELGDERYDEYLYNSKQNNRIRISSVMLGSAAEQAGIQQGDVVLSYDNNRMFTWQELKDATAEGQLGEYVSISIYRDGEIFSFSVPRGPLGMQLGATRLEP